MVVRGLFIVFEGIDGSGKSTQLEEVAKALKAKNKYQDILLTREPTYRASELKKNLKEQLNPFEGGEKDLFLFVEDRKIHTYDQILPAMAQGTVVLCDRYAMSTGAYQSSQGVPIDKIIDFHKKAGTWTPDLTIYVDVPLDVAESRMAKRGASLEKFETDRKFKEILINNYRDLVTMTHLNPDALNVFGPACLINGNQEQSKVTEDIMKMVMPVYESFFLQKK
jgi:dTMP kinase